MVKITREQTKKLVRGLPKEINDEEYNVSYHRQLFYIRKGLYVWNNSMWQEEEIEGAKKLPIVMQELYEEDKGNIGVYKRRQLGLLDEYVYRKINTVGGDRKGRRKEEVSNKSKQVLNYIEIITGEVEGENVVNVKRGNKGGIPQPRREEFQGLSGGDLGNKFKEYVNMRYNGSLDITNNGTQNEMNVVISGIEEGRERLVVNLVRSFDRYLG